MLESIASNEIEGGTGISDLQYLKNILSSTLYGLNKRREFYIFTGTGANGKSLISDALMKPALGEYYKTMSANYYTKSDHSAINCATPELADKQYCRALFSSEPEAEEKLQVAKIKSITGLENIPARQLYQTCTSTLSDLHVNSIRPARQLYQTCTPTLSDRIRVQACLHPHHVV